MKYTYRLPIRFGKKKVNEEINDNKQDKRALQGLCQILRDSLEKRVTTKFDFLFESLPPEVFFTIISSMTIELSQLSNVS